MILYRILAPIIGLIFGARAIWAMIRGGEDWKDVKERLTGPTLTGPSVWVHGASVGEMNAARPVITSLAADGPVLVTVTTITGRATVRAWGVVGVHVALCPLDWRWVTRRMIKRNAIKAMIVIENELWPNRIAQCHHHGLPIIMINARMSAKSARIWQRFETLSRAILHPMRLVAPQDKDSAARLLSLGVQSDRILPPLNLKGMYAPDLSPIPKHLTAFERKLTLLAAATHEDEEEIVLDAFARLRETHPSLKLIIAPRHPRRSQSIAAIIERAGFGCAFHSSDDQPNADVYLADTLGFMHIWYQVAGAAFIGGSLVDKGGHTPFEPAAYSCPIVHGPHVTNFSQSYAALEKANAAARVTDAASLADAGLRHLADAAMAHRASEALKQPDIAPLLVAIKDALTPDT